MTSDHKLFYTWLSQLTSEVTKGDQKVMSDEKLTEFYKEISDDKNDFMDYTNLDMLGYKCIQDFFIMINSKA